jgi:hypothetical protein
MKETAERYIVRARFSAKGPLPGVPRQFDGDRGDFVVIGRDVAAVTVEMHFIAPTDTPDVAAAFEQCYTHTKCVLLEILSIKPEAELVP